MKLKSKLKLKKHHRDEDREERSSGRPSWMITSPQDQREAARQAKMMQNSNRPPELWLKDGDEKQIRIRQEQALACLWRYTVNLGNNKFQAFTMPADGEVDLFRDELGLQPQLRAIYEVIDIKGFRDRNDKRHRNVPRFLSCNGKMHEQLELIKRKRGPLNQYNIDMSRSGERQQTTYAFMPDNPSPMTDEMKKAESLRPKFEQYYSPPTEQEQRLVVNKVSRFTGTSGADEDDDD